MTKEQEEAAERLHVGLVYIQAAVYEAQAGAEPGAEIQLAVIARNKDGTGKLGATFEYENFVKDILTVCGPLKNSDTEDRTKSEER